MKVSHPLIGRVVSGLEVRPRCLVLSKIRCIYCDADGSTEHALGIPIMSIGSYNKMAMRLTKRVARIPREGQHFRFGQPS